MLNLEKNFEIIKKYSYHNKDTSSTELQIILFTFRIIKINNHLKTNLKDYHNKRGLLKLIGKRRKLLNYLKKKKYNIYTKLLIDLNLRK